MGKPGEFGRRLQQLREARKLTQEELSRRSGVSRSYLAKIESGQRENPRVDTLVRLAKGLRVSVLAGESREDVEECIKAYEESPYAAQLRAEGWGPTEEELAFLRYMVGSLWLEGSPTPKALHSFLLGYRASPELRRAR